jgi:drug/metabolite transporter (DMT)-like permease
MTASDTPTASTSGDARVAAPDRAVGIAAVLAATVFWSFGSVLGKAADLPGVVIGFWRMWIAMVLMSVIVVATRRWPTWADIRRSTLIGVLFGFNICAFFITLEYVSIAVALIIGALTPVVALPIAVVFMGERLTGMKVGCALVAVGGVVAAVLTAPSTGGGEDTVVGYVWAVVSLFIWVAYLIAAKQVRRKVETVRLLWVISLTGALTVTVIALVIDADLGAMEGTDWLWVTLLALGPGIVGPGLLAWAQPRVDSSVSSVLIQAEPVGASIAAWVFLGEEMSLAQALSMAVVAGALAVLAYSEARDDTVIVDEAIS